MFTVLQKLQSMQTLSHLKSCLHIIFRTSEVYGPNNKEDFDFHASCQEEGLREGILLAPALRPVATIARSLGDIILLFDVRSILASASLCEVSEWQI